MDKIKANWQKYVLGATVLIVVFVGGILIGKIGDRRGEFYKRQGKFEGREMMNFQGKNWKDNNYQRQSPNLNNNQNIPTNEGANTQATNPSSTTIPSPITK